MSCQRNVCSTCGGVSNTQPNYQKQVDPPARAYGSFLGDPQPEPRSQGRSTGGCMLPMQISLPTFAGNPPPCTGCHNPGQQPCIVKVPCDPVCPSPQIVCVPYAPPPPTKVWLIKSSPVPQKSFAIAQPPPCPPSGSRPIVIPCQPPC